MNCECGEPATCELALRYRKRVGNKIINFGTDGDADMPTHGALCDGCAHLAELATSVRTNDEWWEASIQSFKKAKKSLPDRELTIYVLKPLGWHASVHEAG